MSEPDHEVIHLQAIAHFGTDRVVPACWTFHAVVTSQGVEEVFGDGWLGGQPVHVTPFPSAVTCLACRGMIQ